VESNDRYRFLSVNPAFLKATVLAEDQVVGKLVQEVIPEPSLTMVLKKYKESIGDKKTVRWEETTEYPSGRKAGEVTVAPVFDETGRRAHLIGTVHDITERKLAEETLADMRRKLLEAQEQERARIGRELHDDINQRLALLSVEIDRMKEVSPVTYGELRNRMDELGKRTSEISAVVQSLSHELHSSKMEYLGLVSAMKNFCKEFGVKHKVEIDFSSLIETASKVAKAEHPRVAFCGECLGHLWAEGKTDAAIRLEQACNDLAKRYNVDMLCAYPVNGLHGEEDQRAFQIICAEHSAVHY